MASLKTFIVLSLLCLVTKGDEKVFPGPNITSSISPTKDPTTKIPSTPSISTSPIPTNATTTPTTTTFSTTTTSSTTTKTTSSVTTSTSSPKTTTSSTPKTTTTTMTTTAKPTTPQPLIPGKWSANYTTSNTTCLVLEGALQIVLLYKMNNTTKTYQVNVPPAALAQGNCSSKTENITLRFANENMVTFNIVKSNDSKSYDVDSILVTLKANLPYINVTQFILVHEKNEFSTPLSNSYKCTPEKSLNLTALNKSADYSGELHISHFQIQAFRNSTNQKFDEAIDCEGSETPDVVPIAVGCALAALVIIVLVAYLIGRRRSQARGYLSM